jgi:hypothetical protein
MYLITLKVFKICLKMFAPITKVNEAESNTPCPSTLEVTYSSVEKLSTAFISTCFPVHFWAQPNLSVSNLDQYLFYIWYQRKSMVYAKSQHLS